MKNKFGMSFINDVFLFYEQSFVNFNIYFNTQYLILFNIYVVSSKFLIN